MGKTAILVDGAFYRRQAFYLFGDKSPELRADELVQYCRRHLKEPGKKDEEPTYRELYRILYYDCPPSDKIIRHPLTDRTINLKRTGNYNWTIDFYKALASKRKVALRMGELQEPSIGYSIKPDVVKKLCKREKTIDELTENDFSLAISQKGVDMRIGLDIASLAQKRLVDQIVLIAGDSDFVPAAKHARREGIDFILDPMWHTIKSSLNMHVDGLRSRVDKPPQNLNDPLHISHISTDAVTDCEDE